MTNGLVAILGETGKNFAAGMSGGIAYVLDESGEFCKNRCNRLGVDLEPVESGSDINALRNLIDRHVQFTASPRGKWILENWGDMQGKFVKVFPHEYKRVLGVAKRETPYFVASSQGEQVLHG
jgi:glutamate synthase domain-containing protein 3